MSRAPRYLELKPIPLVFQSFTIGYLELPAISNCFLFPLSVRDSGRNSTVATIRKCMYKSFIEVNNKVYTGTPPWSTTTFWILFTFNHMLNKPAFFSAEVLLVPCRITELSIICYMLSFVHRACIDNIIRIVIHLLHRLVFWFTTACLVTFPYKLSCPLRCQTLGKLVKATKTGSGVKFVRVDLNFLL